MELVKFPATLHSPGRKAKWQLNGNKNQTNCPYCWWKKSCTTWYVWNPLKPYRNNGINYLSTGAGFQPSTVGIPANTPNKKKGPCLDKPSLTSTPSKALLIKCFTSHGGTTLRTHHGCFGDHQLLGSTKTHQETKRFSTVNRKFKMDPESDGPFIKEFLF